MKNVFNKEDINEIIIRINNLNPTSKPLWGKMTAAQMFAHCNVAYEMIYTDIHPKPGVIMRFILRTFIKKVVVNEKPYKRNNKTAPQFIIKDVKDFNSEKERLIVHIKKTQELGEDYFDNKESHSFGVLSKTEWNNMLYKHLDHHLRQFGV